MAKKLTIEEFISKASNIHRGFYDYSRVEYTGNRNKIIIVCPIHGEFRQMAQSHLKGCGCKFCRSENMTLTTEEFIKKAKEVHKDEFSYEESKYKSHQDRLIITCKEHGNFNQTPNHHLAGAGCPYCRHENLWSRSGYTKMAKGRICTFYTLRCFNEQEEFYKIGITMNGVKIRYHSIKDMPYTYEVVSEIRGEAGFIWDLELIEKRRLKEFRYQPEIEFKGSKTECFTQHNI